MRVLMIDPQCKHFNLAIVDNHKTVFRGSKETPEQVRLFEVESNIDKTYIDCGYEAEKVRAMNTLWGWELFKGKANSPHFIDLVIYG